MNADKKDTEDSFAFVRRWSLGECAGVVGCDGRCFYGDRRAFPRVWESAKAMQILCVEAVVSSGAQRGQVFAKAKHLPKRDKVR